MKALCVYCGSNLGNRQDYAAAARKLAGLLVANRIDLVYGGASKGLMGVLADAVLESGGKVHGVIPRVLLGKEIAHPNLSKLHVVASMHERKALMAELSDGFIAMPGGFGTLEEIIEILTWAQLQFHAKPCGLLDVSGYFGRLQAFLDHAEAEGFVKPQHRKMLLVHEDPAELLRRLEGYRAPTAQKWMS